MSPDKLVYMANQIATFFATQRGEDKIEMIAAHLKNFWEPRMRNQLFDLISAGGKGLDPMVVEAATRLQPRN